MRISPVSVMPKNNFTGRQIGTFEGRPVYELDKDTPDNAIVAVGSWDSSYRFPIYAYQVRQEMQAKQEKPVEKPVVGVEPYEDYYKRKIGSPEWGAY